MSNSNVNKRHLSGSEKRKRRKLQEKLVETQRHSLDAFLSRNKSDESGSRGHDDVADAFVVNVATESDSKGGEQSKDVLHNDPVNIDEDPTATSVAQEEEPNITDDKDNKVKNEDNLDNDEYPLDIGMWPKQLTSGMVNYYLLNKPRSVGDMSTLKVTYTDRNISKSNFYCTKSNGEKVLREWLQFSDQSKCVYCYPCKLFCTSNVKLITGFNDWKKLSAVLKQHENSMNHVKAMLTLKKRSSILGRVNTQLLTQMKSEENYWREVLRRVAATVKLLATVAFRGHRENQESTRKGNFLHCIEYLAEFDAFLKEHLKRYSNVGKGNVNYLSHSVYDEFISVMAKKVIHSITSQVKKAMYFSIIVDSTPDISHMDQLTFILRFVDEKGDIQERFFGFLKIDGHDAAHLENVVLTYLQDLTLNIDYCRGQAYDNAANMSGKYTGQQARIQAQVDTATYVPCSAHSLNLIGISAAESCSGALHYFNFVQNVYTFFSSSTRRWNTFIQNMKDSNSKRLKRVIDTRWSARADAVSALKLNYAEIKNVLHDLSTDEREKPVGKLEAKKLKESFDLYETALMTVLWDKLLQRINSVSLSLQTTQSNLLLAVKLLNSLSDYIAVGRTNFDEIENSANILTNSRNYKEVRQKKRKLQFDESRVQLTGKQAFVVNTYNVICDTLIGEISRRSEVYKEVVKDFQIFFTDDPSQDEINTCVEKLGRKYAKDIDSTNLTEEVIHFLQYIKEEDVPTRDPGRLYKIVIDGLQSTFPNIETILKIFLTMPISNASGERSFSVLKRVKNYLRNSLNQQHLNELSMLYIENDITQQIDYDDVINDFAKQKARKVTI
ncbi:hypothetical protein PPYR_02359 [Photinus pyralis]|uniref:TTF-type domain-containing protein n=1 Tax=Photinus pyralis TaxID=7054 RepID=A0A5N4B711_PHOPY|nr:hypothetical protein PPYR_02359 [Photinus pyralis]